MIYGKSDEVNQTIIKLQQLLGRDLLKFLNYQFFQQGEDFVTELLHQTWLKVWINAKQCTGDTQRSILKWVKTIAYHTGLNMIRDDKMLQESISIEESKPDKNRQPIQDNLDAAQGLWDNQQPSFRPVEESVIFQEKMEKLIKELSKQEYKVFSYSKDGYTGSEIAKLLSISKPRVSQYIKQIIKKNKKQTQ
jgi:RNA polymerase sigma factor (sigma-70 family)